MLRKSKTTSNRHPMIEERAMIEAAKKDPSQFEALYVLYYEAIFRYVHQRVKDKDTAQDVVSQVFLKALINIKSYEYRGFPFSSWLYRIAMSETSNLFKKQKVTRAININEETLQGLIDEVNEEAGTDFQQLMVEALRNLDEDDLLLIEMRFFEQRRFAEIGEIMNITENNAKVKLYRVIEKIKKIVKEK